MEQKHVVQSMRWIRWTSVGLAAVTAVAAIATQSCTVSGSRATEATAAEKIERGRRLAWTSGCNDCHTPGTFYGAPDTTRLLSGSELGWEGPWGVTYPRNLTPHLETGLGSWSEQDIVTAFRQGHRPDLSPVLPPMPWPAYAHMTDEDAYALAAYLKSLPPIEHRVPDRIPPGAKAEGPRLTIPPPPEWDGRNLPPPTAQAVPGS